MEMPKTVHLKERNNIYYFVFLGYSLDILCCVQGEQGGGHTPPLIGKINIFFKLYLATLSHIFTVPIKSPLLFSANLWSPLILSTFLSLISSVWCIIFNGYKCYTIPSVFCTFYKKHCKLGIIVNSTCFKNRENDIKHETYI